MSLYVYYVTVTSVTVTGVTVTKIICIDKDENKMTAAAEDQTHAPPELAAWPFLMSTPLKKRL